MPHFDVLWSTSAYEGQSNAILEAMAAGVPIVATEKAAEGLGLRHREHFLLAKNQQEFVDAIAAIFERHGMTLLGPPLSAD